MGYELKSVEVELTLTPGLPQFQIMGLPDTNIKESQLRIKSALKHQGFDWPAGKKVLVNLRPAYMKKSSRGLDLAIAAAYLWKTGQVQLPESAELPYVYGEISLEGQVDVPDDLDTLFEQDRETTILTGTPDHGISYPLLTVNELKDLHQPVLIPAQPLQTRLQRPDIPGLHFPPTLAQLMKVTALGNHSLLLAGPAGSGKSTLAYSLHYLMSEPIQEEALRIYQIGKWFQNPTSWRPLVNPHHTTTSIAMIGGGSPPFPGEITRAHGGMLLLDEFLEFPARVKESLREPIERGEMTVARRGQNVSFPAKFQLVATTNLCPCGDYIPGKNTDCSRSLQRCRSYIDRLSGPILDRFELLFFTDQKYQLENPKIPLQEIFEQIEAARKFQNREIPNSDLSLSELESHLKAFTRQNLMPETGASQRRKLALLRVARSLADLDQSAEIMPIHLDQAAKLSLLPFEKIKRF